MRIGRVVSSGVIILAVLAATPWIDGFFFKKNYYHFVKALETNKAVNIKIMDYQQGWLHSKAKVAVTQAAMGKESTYTTPTIILEQSISHGPLAYDAGNHRLVIALATIRSNIHLPAAIEAILLGTQANTQGVVESNMIATLSGDYLSHIKTPVFNMSIPNTVDTVWQGLNGSMDFKMQGRRLQKVTTDMTLGAFSAKGKGLSLAIQEAQLKYSISPDVGGLWKGAYDLTFPGITLIDASNASTLEAKNLKLAYLFGAATPHFYDANFQFAAEQLILSNAWQISQLHNNLAFQNISTQALVNLVDTVNHFKDNPTLFTPEQYQQQVTTLLPSLITTQTLFKEELALNTSYGPLSLKAEAMWPQAIKEVQEIPKKVKAKADLRVASALLNQLITDFSPHSTATQGPSPAEQTKQQLAVLIQRGIITQDKTDYVTAITVEEGVVKANGIEVQRLP